MTKYTEGRNNWAIILLIFVKINIVLKKKYLWETGVPPNTG